MKPGELRKWISSTPSLADIGDLMLVIDETQENPLALRMVRFLCNGAYLSMTWQWVMLNTEAIDETR